MSLNLLTCPHCGMGNFPGNHKCKECGQFLRNETIKPIAEPELQIKYSNKSFNGSKKAIITIVWILSMGCSGLAFLQYLNGTMYAISAPQQAAAAAMACALAIIPYCAARAFTEIARLD